MSARDRVLALLKFGQRVHMKALVDEGVLHMQPLSAFKSLEDDEMRADPNEALLQSVVATGAELSVEEDGRWIPLRTLTGALRSADESLRRVNVFCTHIILSGRCATHPRELVDPQNFKFGDSFVIFTDGDEFLRRVRAAAEKCRLELQTAPVQYVDPNSYSGSMGVFRKYSPFAFQSEWRIALLPGTGEPYQLRIGSLADITRMGKLSEINERLRWSPSARLQVRD